MQFDCMYFATYIVFSYYRMDETLFDTMKTVLCRKTHTDGDICELV